MNVEQPDFVACRPLAPAGEDAYRKDAVRPSHGLLDFLAMEDFSTHRRSLRGDRRVRTLSCVKHFRVMTFAKLRYRESLRDIEVCLSAQASKLYRMGISQTIARSTLADANERRDWRVYAEQPAGLFNAASRYYYSSVARLLSAHAHYDHQMTGEPIDTWDAR